jgi:8-oxo-dGTP diphosphatase
MPDGWPAAITDAGHAPVVVATTVAELATFLRDPPDWHIAHLTAIAWVLDASRSRILLVEHRLHGWSCAGGHVEPGEHPATTAARELAEETGLVAVPDEHPFMLGSSLGCARAPQARHWTIGYLFTVDPSAPLRAEPGQPATWFAVDRLPAKRTTDIDAVLAAISRA